MQCERAQEFLSDHVEQTLDRPMRLAVDAHLADCGSCREDLARLRVLYRALEAVPEVEPPTDSIARVIHRLQTIRYEEAQRAASPGGFAGWLRTLRPVSVALGAGLAALVIGGSFLLNRVGNHEQLNLIGPAQRPTQQSAVAAPRLTLQLGVTLGPPTSAGRSVRLQVTPSADLPRATVRVLSQDLPFTPGGDGDITPTRPAVLDFLLPAGPRVRSFWVQVQATTMATPYRALIAAPLTAPPQAGGTSALAIHHQPLTNALELVAASSTRPIVAVGVEGEVNLQAEDVTPRRALDLIAEQVQGRVEEDATTLHLVAK